jgi:hypothetical protein
MIDVEREKFHLELEFQKLLREISGDQSLIGTELVKKLNIRPQSPPLWTEQFSPLTLLYPRFQVVEFPQIPGEMVRQAAVAHLCLLVHAFVEDRVLDGQVELDQNLESFMERLAGRGIQLLDEMSGSSAGFANWINGTWGQYREAQLLTYEDFELDPSTLCRSAISRVAAGRAIHGKLATMTLLKANGFDPKALRRASNAYDCLVIGMQWVDDMKDFSEDLAVQDENILLMLLRRIDGTRSREMVARGDANEVGAALADSGLFTFAGQRASRWFSAAARWQYEFGSRSLEMAVRERMHEISELRDSMCVKFGGLSCIDQSKRIAE